MYGGTCLFEAKIAAYDENYIILCLYWKILYNDLDDCWAWEESIISALIGATLHIHSPKILFPVTRSKNRFEYPGNIVSLLGMSAPVFRVHAQFSGNHFISSPESKIPFCNRTTACIPYI